MAATPTIVLGGAALIWEIFRLLARNFRAGYERDVDRALAQQPSSAPTVTDDELEHLPAPVQRYLRAAGVVGNPRVHNFRMRMRGRIRSGPAARWIPFESEQYNIVEAPARFFYLTGSMLMIPVLGYHRYVGSSATMTIKAAALVPVVDAGGPEMNQSETVTLLNDMCIMAPATLTDRRLRWEAVDGRTARVTFTNAGHTVAAELSFDDGGELTNFRSDDRYQLSADGRSARLVRWSTPIKDHRRFGNVRLASAGEGRWHEADSDYAYIELTIDQVEYNVRLRS